ncbi:hypothetical protein EVC37_08175 [Methylocaldum sp. BRCS4]|nr:hypothetical protein [Methylocaldum sp. BRCS4]
MSVEKWKATRFRQTYPGFQVEVVDSDGAAVHGNTRLGTVRDTYLDEEWPAVSPSEEQAHAD